jgi:hypothetical protein
MATLADFLALVGEINIKVLDLQAKLAAGGLTAAEEEELNNALKALSQTADPTQPNP